MGAEWRQTSLDDLVEIKHGFAFQGEFFRDTPPGDVLLTPGNFAIGGGFKRDKLKYYTGPVPEEFVLSEGDLLVTMTDLSKSADTLGYPALVPGPLAGRRYLHNQRLGKVIAREGAPVEKRFLFYVLCSREYRNEIIASATGTTVKHTSPTRIGKFRFKLPGLGEQRAVAHILGTLDDKIELNRRMNEMLEAVARALFKSWFVDFDPIRAMAEDGVPARLAACIAGRFPRRSQDGVPEGWQEQRLGDIADVNWGDTSKTKSSYTSEGYPAYSASGPDGFTSRYMFHNTGVVLSAIGANCGMTWLALGKWSCIKNTIRFWSTSPDVPTEFLFYATSGADKWPQRGSAQPFIAQHDARNVSVLIPTNNLATIFAEIVRPLHEKKDAAEQQNRTLAALRDTLLPKLISGELRVKDAERIIGRSLP